MPHGILTCPVVSGCTSRLQLWPSLNLGLMNVAVRTRYNKGSRTRHYRANSFNKNIIRALSSPEAGRVTTHARMMFLNSDQSTLSLDLTRPTNTMEPTLQCVVEIGIPTYDATRTVNAAPSSIQKPLKNRKENILLIT